MATPPMSEYRQPRISQTQLMAAVSVMQVVLTLIIAPLATWGLARIVDYGERITAIEGNTKDWENTEQRLRNIERSLDRVLAKLGDNPRSGE